MKNILKLVLLGFIAFTLSNCKSDKLVGTPQLSSTEDVIIVKSFTGEAPTYNEVDFTPTIEHDGLGRVPGTDATTTKVSVPGQWFAVTLKRTGEATNVFIIAGNDYNPGDTVCVSLREYNEGPCLVGPYSPPPVATSTTQPKGAPTPKGKADWQP